MSEQSAASKERRVEQIGTEPARVRPVMWAGTEFVGYQCLTCKGEGATSHPGIAGATERIRCTPCNGSGYVPRSE